MQLVYSTVLDCAVWHCLCNTGFLVPKLHVSPYRLDTGHPVYQVSEVEEGPRC